MDAVSRVRLVAIVLMFAIAASTAPVTSASQTSAEPSGGKGHLHYRAKARIDGRDALIDVMLAKSAEGQEEEIGRAALEEIGLADAIALNLDPDPTDPSVLWTRVGETWRRPLPIVFGYNPSGEPVPGLSAFGTSLDAWTGIPTSKFAFATGGTTTNCASLLGCFTTSSVGFRDGQNVIAWKSLGSFVAGIANISDGSEVDILLNRSIFWGGCDLQAVMTHELGHSTGLGHSGSTTEIMYPFLGSRCEPGAGDAAGLTYLYPEQLTSVTGTVRHDPSGVPLASSVRARPVGGPQTGSADTRAASASDGRFELRVPRGLRYALTASTRDFGINEVLIDAVDESVTADFSLSGKTPISVEHPDVIPEGSAVGLALELPEPFASATSTAVEVNYSITGGQSSSFMLPGPTDLQPVGGTVRFAIGDQRIELPPIVIPQDDLHEPADVLKVSLDTASTEHGIAIPILSIPVADDDALVISIADTSAMEGAQLVFDIGVTNAPEFQLPLTISAIDGTATGSLDFGNVGNASLAGGETHTSVTVPTFTDFEPETDEKFTLVVEAGGARAEAVGTILDDTDTDGDGVRDTVDLDDDDDTDTDAEEASCGSDPRDAASRCATLIFTGFSTPVDNTPLLNVATAGRTIPLGYRLTADDGTPVEDPATFVRITSAKAPCGALDDAGSDTLETYSGASGLQYLGDGYWQVNWATSKSYSGTTNGPCRVLTLELSDGRAHEAYFRFK